MIPADYAGTLVTDRAPLYDATALANVKPQKCLAPIQRSLSQVLVTKVGRGRSFAKQLKALFTEATELWRHQRAGPMRDWDQRVQALEDRLTELLRDRRLPDRDNQRLLDELGRHHDRGNVLRFLRQPEVPPDNNAAHRAHRPTVRRAARSRHRRGAHQSRVVASSARIRHRRASLPRTARIGRAGYLALLAPQQGRTANLDRRTQPE
ncbi:MAG: transposase [Chloroflexi bacterium]|nr:transposase [Chloroflexota bacterium]